MSPLVGCPGPWDYCPGVLWSGGLLPGRDFLPGGTFGRGDFWPGDLLSGGLLPGGGLLSGGLMPVPP